MVKRDHGEFDDVVPLPVRWVQVYALAPVQLAGVPLPLCCYVGWCLQQPCIAPSSMQQQRCAMLQGGQ